MLKDIHVTTVIITITLFLLRAFWGFTRSAMMQRKWVRIVPHVNDTILFITAAGLSISLQQYPFVHGWVTAKVVALLFYIVFASYALKRARSKRSQLIFFILALATVSYIVSVALTRNPVWFLS